MVNVMLNLFILEDISIFLFQKLRRTISICVLSCARHAKACRNLTFQTQKSRPFHEASMMQISAPRACKMLIAVHVVIISSNLMPHLQFAVTLIDADFSGI